MAGGGALDILVQIQALVSDKLQVVSYKWLSRNFSVSSNYAKRLLQEFVEKHGNELEVLYTLSGWLKNNPQTYGIRLVSGLNLADAKQEFRDNCSVQVYSVQACIPKDLAVLWSAEFVQAEELFNQPSTAENCFRDNRFCGVSNSFVKRILDGKSLNAALPHPKSSPGVDVQSKTYSMLKDLPIQPPKQEYVGQSSAKNALQSCPVITTGDKADRVAPKVTDQTSKPHVVKESASAVHGNKRKSQNEKPMPGTGGSLASLWGRASAKSKPLSPAKDSNDFSKAALTAEAQIGVHESADAASSDEDGHDVNFKRESNGASSRKRRVVMDFSDDDNEEENVVGLASPDPPNGQPVPISLHNTGNFILEKKNLNFEEQKADALDVRQVSTKEQNSGLSSEDDKQVGSKSMIAGISLQEKTQSCIQEGLANKSKEDKATDSTSTSPKRRKVLKTRIDERGREVTEVVWEGEAADSVNAESIMTSSDAGNRAPITNKAPAAAGSNAPTHPASKAGNKKPAKGGGKDPKQGNILSFFKKT